MWRCDRFFGMWGRSLLRDLGDVIAFFCMWVRSLFRMWEGDRFFGGVVSVRSLLGDVGMGDRFDNKGFEMVRSFFGCV